MDMEMTENLNLTQKKLDPYGILQAYSEVYYSWLSQPEKIYTDFTELLELGMQVNAEVMKRAVGDPSTPVIPANAEDQFTDPSWQESPCHDFLKEAYLLNSYFALRKIASSPNVSQISKDRASFWTQQIFNALSPANFFFTNPKAVMTFLETGGKSMEDGLRLLAEDLIKQNISTVDASGFKVGENISTTKGKVVFRNDIFELIQYTPVTENVYSMPIVIVPPWINKYYILDLNSKKSMVQYLLNQQHTVFLISWRNPPASMRDTTFTDYLMDGILKATTVARQIAKSEQVHCVGYCVGGTALTTLIAWLNSRQQEVKHNPIAHFTLFCSLLTFEKPGGIDIFIDENIVEQMEASMDQLGYLDGKQMGQTFRLLRSNSLIWSYFTNSYLLGQKPMAFDVMYWNSDNTRIPAKVHSFYLRNYYLNNNLARKNALEIKQQKLDLAKITQPVYAVGTEQDHITPWKETFKSIQLLGGEKRYALSTSGHIVGIINPPSNPPKREYWVNSVHTQECADKWLAGQAQVKGTWWEDWATWLADKCGPLQAPPAMGSAEYQVIGDAPGVYVLEK